MVRNAYLDRARVVDQRVQDHPDRAADCEVRDQCVADELERRDPKQVTAPGKNHRGGGRANHADDHPHQDRT